jgi:APA family basic amino acid/polyamine antiporter
VNQTLVQKLTRTKPVDNKNAEHASSSNSLHRSIGLFPLTMIGVGATIGTGIFFTMVEAVPKAGPSVILSFLIAAITAGLTALCYAELSFRIPASGSSYSFAYATVGEFLAFIMAACLLLEYGLAASAVRSAGRTEQLPQQRLRLAHPRDAAHADDCLDRARH